MPKEEREKKRNRKKNLRILLVLGILFYMIFRSVPFLSASNFKTTTAQEGYIEDKIKASGVIIRDEQVYLSDGEGRVNVVKNEGEKVKAGANIVKLSLNKDNASLKGELEEVNKKIKSLEKVDKGENIQNRDNQKSTHNLANIVDKIQESIAEEDLTEMEALTDSLDCCMGKKKNIDGKDTLSDSSLENLQNKKEEILNKISDNTTNYLSKESGVVSYSIDGLEEIYPIKKIYDFSYDDLNREKLDTKKIKSGDTVKAGEPIFKIMDNLNWYLALKIENIKDIEPLKEGDTVYVSFDPNDNKRVKGQILKINKNKSKASMIIKFDTFFSEYYNYRYVDVDIIKSKYEGLKVPNKSIVKKEGIKGVYIKDIDGIVKFRPVNILGQDDEFTIVDVGDKNKHIMVKGSDEKEKTLKLFDEVIIDSDKVEEGQIID